MAAGVPREEDDEEEEVESGDDRSGSGSESGSEEASSEPASLADLCDPDACSDEDPTFDPTADGDVEVEAVLQSRMARMSISSHMGRKGSLMPKMGREEIDLLSMVNRLMNDSQLEKLKVKECKAYLRMHKLRLSGTKEVLLNRIRDHIEVKNMGEVKYPVSSFVLNCQGDSCKGDVVMFVQNIYKRKKGAPRGVKGRVICGQRTNAGRIIKESYGTRKQQHTFTIEILWSKGHKPWPPLHPLLIKGRNLYKDKTMRQPWPDEEERTRVLQEKHERGFVARKTRADRIKEKENEQIRRLNRSDEKLIPPFQHGEPGNTVQQQISSKQSPTKQNFHYPMQFPCPQQHNLVLLQKGTARTSTAQFINHQAPSLQCATQAETRQQPESLKSTSIQPVSVYPQQYPKNQHHKEVLPQELTNTIIRQDLTNHRATPSQQHGGSENSRQQQISSRATTPTQQIFDCIKQPSNHQYQNEVLRQQDWTRTSLQ